VARGTDFMKRYKKSDFPIDQVRRYLEPGPIVLVSSMWKGHTNIMTLGWQTVMEFSPSLVGCVIASSNHSFEMIRKSRECVINVPTIELAREVVKIGNCSGDKVDKFEKFGLTPMPAVKVKSPLIAECPASFECRLADGRMINRYNFFIFEVVKAHVARSPKYLKTMHYHGKGVFTLAGKTINLNRLFSKWRDV
jgi:flavin reductase (DIM6/NTAB) family NADH-FMN oxidoreductase RutF